MCVCERVKMSLRLLVIFSMKLNLRAVESHLKFRGIGSGLVFVCMQEEAVWFVVRDFSSTSKESCG